jgi:hypothetical protein
MQLALPGPSYVVVIIVCLAALCRLSHRSLLFVSSVVIICLAGCRHYSRQLLLFVLQLSPVVVLIVL